jgi:hypothetical protein
VKWTVKWIFLKVLSKAGWAGVGIFDREMPSLELQENFNGKEA